VTACEATGINWVQSMDLIFEKSTNGIMEIASSQRRHACLADPYP
jgi:hypothetical protein